MIDELNDDPVDDTTIDKTPGIDAGYDRDDDPHDDGLSIVRPYIMTGGRTRATMEDLSVETVIVTSQACAADALNFERRAIATLCDQPWSIAEVAGTLDLPLGVARFLVSEMAAEGLVDTSGRVESIGIAMIEQLIEGIRAL